jgi:hypothetical protein
MSVILHTQVQLVQVTCRALDQYIVVMALSFYKIFFTLGTIIIKRSDTYGLLNCVLLTNDMKTLLGFGECNEFNQFFTFIK